MRSDVHDISNAVGRPSLLLPLLGSGVETMTDANRRTSINLDDETYEIAKRLGNRSEFVRECLRRWNAHDQATHIHPTETDRCLPWSKKGCCILCWPYGPPDVKDWKYYRESGGKVVVGQTPQGNPIMDNNVSYANDWIDEKARDANQIRDFAIPTEERFQKSRKSISSRGVKGFLAKLWKGRDG